MTDPLSVAALSRTAPRVKFRPAQFHIVASQLPCVGRKLRPQQAWVHSVGNRGCIYWPFSGPSEPPCRTAAIDRSCTICAARGRSGSSVTADSPFEQSHRSAAPVPFANGDGQDGPLTSKIVLLPASRCTAARPAAAATAMARIAIALRDTRVKTLVADANTAAFKTKVVDALR